MIVIAKPGSRCPKEGKPREYINDTASTEVPDSAYYHRLVADGSLTIVPDEKENDGSPAMPGGIEIQDTAVPETTKNKKKKGGKS